MCKVTFHRTTLSQCVHHGDAGFWHITALSAPNISHHRLHTTQEYWYHEALEKYITLSQDSQDFYTKPISSKTTLHLQTKRYKLFISLYKILHALLCHSRSWSFIAIFLSQMVFVKIHSRILHEDCHKSILSTSFKLILKLYYQPDKTLAIMITVGTLEQPEHVQYLPNLSQISFVTIHLTQLAHSLSLQHLPIIEQCVV